jgi:outer membrane protein assembly factor BamB
MKKMSAAVLRENGPASSSKSKILLPRLVVFAAIVASALSGCGGGGGGSSSTGSSGTGNNAGNSAQLEVSPLQVNLTAQTTDSAPTAVIQASIQVSSSASTTTQFYITGSQTENGIGSVNESVTDNVDNITVNFKVPATLGPGTYTDTLTLKGCYDQACTQQVSNSPQSVSISYTVILPPPPQPQIYSISPTSATAGAPSFTLTVGGSTFVPQSVVLWNGSPLATTYVSANQLTAQVGASNISNSGNYSVTVSNGVGAVSSAAMFTVAPLATLSLSSISPTQVAAGGSDFMLTAIGTGFASTSSIAWNGTIMTTTYLSSTMLRAKVTAAQIVNTGTVAITVSDSGGQGSSAPINLTIVAPTVDAVAYQMNPAHTGAVTFKTVALPSNSAWSVDVGGSASYALIVGGQVFVTVAINGNAQLLALNGATGATVWGPIAFSGNVNAAYDRGRVFVVSGSPQSQIISALDAASGNPVWSATVPGGWVPAPPVAADGIVYTTNGGLVTAFDETAGAMLWQSDISGTSGIVAVTVDGLYGASPCTAVDLLPATGTQIWFNDSGCSGGATPVAANGLVYAPANSAGSSGTVFDAETGATKANYSASVIPAFSSTAGFFLFNGTLQGLAVSNNQVLWSFAGDGQLTTAPIVVNSYVFVGSGSGNLYALDAASGQQLWNQNLGAAIPANNEYTLTEYTGLAAGDGLLVVPNGTKVTAFVLSASP